MPRKQDPDKTPMTSQEEQRAQWERALLDEVKAWREAALELGVSDPRYLTTHVMNVRQQIAYLDAFVFAVAHETHGNTDNSKQNWKSLYLAALHAWDARDEFLTELFAQHARSVSPTIPPSGGIEADPDNKGQ